MTLSIILIAGSVIVLAYATHIRLSNLEKQMANQVKISQNFVKLFRDMQDVVSEIQVAVKKILYRK